MLTWGGGLEPDVGFYRARLVKKGPWVPIRIMQEGGLWFVLRLGRVLDGSGEADPFRIPFLRSNWPLHPVSELEYQALVAAHENAPPGSPLRQPDEPVDLRKAPPL